MELRVLQYFLTVAREQSISRAAEVLHMTQPPLSRQLMDLEKELGKSLFIRGSRRITLTEEGIILRKRAEEMLELMEKARAEVTAAEDTISGEIYIGSGETEGFRIIAEAAKRLRDQYPEVRFNLFSGNAEDVLERLDHGLLDLAVVISPTESKQYEYVSLPAANTMGLLVRRDHPLSKRAYILPQDLTNIPLIVPRKLTDNNRFTNWLGGKSDRLSVVAVYNLLYNASLMVEEGVGCALCLGGIIPEHDRSLSCFRPLKDHAAADLAVIWKKDQMLTKPAVKLLEEIRKSRKSLIG